MACAICQTRRPRRFCPGVNGEICSICCGTEREVTVTCPLDCEFLAAARIHDKPQAVDAEQFPNQDIRITEKFLEEHERLAAFLGHAVLEAALATPGACDFDVREALEALIKTYRTLESGVYYDTLPENRVAAAIFRGVQQRMQESKARTGEVLGVLAFLQRLEFDRNNGRRRGRAFLGMLHDFYGDPPVAAGSPESPLILP